AMVQSLKQKGWTLGVDLFAYDKYKNEFNTLPDLLKTQIIFLALPTLFEELTKTYNLDALHESLNWLKLNAYRGLVVIKSTVQPQTTSLLARIYGLDLVHNPEFLTARTALDDFNNQKHIVLGWDGRMTDEKFSSLVNFYQINY